MYTEYPTITRRYLSTAIDFMFILSTAILISYIFQSTGEFTGNIRVALILFLFFVYEPLFTSLFCTVGQLITRIRVRRRVSLSHISIAAAYLRTLIKVFLGLVSFFTIPFAKERRAIHDFAVNSVVIYKGR
jgi:uncharacterized RDD family membrane protein YckC